MAAVILRDLQSCFSLGTGVVRGKRLESGFMVTEPVGWNKHQEKWLNLTMEFGKPFMPAYVAEPSLLAFFQSHNDDFGSKTNLKALTRKNYIALMWQGRSQQSMGLRKRAERVAWQWPVSSTVEGVSLS